jgi:hypothetical protein
MRLTPPSTLGSGFPVVGVQPAASSPLTPTFYSPPCPPLPLDYPTQPESFDLQNLLNIPPFNTTTPETPSQYAGQFDDFLYGHTPTRITKATTRFVSNNPNGVTRDDLYHHLMEYLMELLDIGVDVIQLPEANID